jgi:hypothetical protein
MGFLTVKLYKIDKYKEATCDGIVQVITSNAMRSMWSSNIWHSSQGDN